MSQTAEDGSPGGARSPNDDRATRLPERPPFAASAEVDFWVEDARRRGLPELEPLLRSLAEATAALRAADWNDTVAPRAFRPSATGGL